MLISRLLRLNTMSLGCEYNIGMYVSAIAKISIVLTIFNIGINIWLSQLLGNVFAVTAFMLTIYALLLFSVITLVATVVMWKPWATTTAKYLILLYTIIYTILISNILWLLSTVVSNYKYF
jgi:hypothetical protein